MHAGRATADVDFAFSVRDWAQFHQLGDALVATEHFARVTHQQRLLYRDPERGFSIPVDLVPFHGVARADQKIAWPPEGEFVMNVAGFEEALASALSIEIESSLVVRVTSIPGLLVLKLIAWLDRNAINNKDAADISTLLNSYAFAGNEDRLYGQEQEILEAVGYDLVLAGAHLLGSDAAWSIRGEAAEQVRALLASEPQIDRLLSQMIGSAGFSENNQTVEHVFDQFRLGFLGTAD
ncbi:MAG: nucleotidyl transferase AbiEii/AbiGii toxin family protein [Bryobacteraceae bacterium]